MNVTRRNACLLLPFLGSLSAWSSSSNSLPSSMQPFESLPVAKEGQATYRDILEGTTHTGDFLEVHETVLEPNAAPHPAHHHAAEELFLVSSGTLEITISGKSVHLGPGSAAFVASGEEHGLRNVGSGPAQYFVVTVGSKAS
ncbi:MAG: cupin domain-containing protein [Terriglobales bacterium]